jgi:GT2 family glycosyltransferase
VYDLEHGREGPYRWLSGEAELLVPLPDPGSQEGGAGPPHGSGTDHGAGPLTAEVAASSVRHIELLLAAEAPTTAVVVVEDRPHEVEVGPEPRWVSVDVAGEGVDVVQNAGSLVYADGAGADREFGREVTLAVHVPADVFAWCGGAVLLRRAYLEDVGLFHEPFFLYYEDTDLSWRGQARGWRYRFVPGTVVRHAHAGSSGTSSPRFAHFNERNRLLFLFRNAPPALVRREVVGHLRETLDMAWRDTLGPLRRRSRPRPVVAARRARAFAAFVALAPHELGERRRLRRAQQVPDATLLARLTPR